MECPGPWWKLVLAMPLTRWKQCCKESWNIYDGENPGGGRFGPGSAHDPAVTREPRLRGGGSDRWGRGAGTVRHSQTRSGPAGHGHARHVRAGGPDETARA